MSESQARNRRRTVIGVVTSDKMDKTISVRVDRMVQHPKFKKYIRRSTVYKAHDEKNEAHVGDRVVIQECRRLSRTKAFRLTEILERSRLRVAQEVVPDVPVAPEMES